MATDPVCFALVDDAGTQITSMYNKKKYYFCTNFCKKKFDENPQKYSRNAIDLTIEPGGASC
jgi:YHS domain-containing protein